MNKHDYDLEQRAEELLKAFAMEMGENNEAFVNAFLDEDQPDPSVFAEPAQAAPPASSAADTASDDFAPAPSRRSRKILRRTLILAAVLILMMGLVVCTSEGVRLKLSSLFFGDAPGSTRVMDDSNLVVDLEKVELGYVPEGFEVVSDICFEDIERMIDYANDEGIPITCSITKTDQYVHNVDNERNGSTKVIINDKQGYLFFDGNHNIIVWQLGDCTVDIMSPIDEKEIVEIAKSITVAW